MSSQSLLRLAISALKCPRTFCLENLLINISVYINWPEHILRHATRRYCTRVRDSHEFGIFVKVLVTHYFLGKLVP